MSRQVRTVGRLAAASCLALAASAAAGPVTHAAEVSLGYQCTYPLIGQQPLQIAISTALPATADTGERIPALAIKAVATPGGDTASGLALILARSLEGTASASATVRSPGSSGLKVKVPIAIEPYAIPSSGALALRASGSTPALQFNQPGVASIDLDALTLNLTARDAAGAAIRLPAVGADSDGDPDTFDVSCTVDPAGQSPVLGVVGLRGPGDAPDGVAPTAPGGLGAQVAATSAALSWSASTDDAGVIAYEVYQGGVLVQTVRGTATTVAGLAPSTSYGFTVRARDAAGNLSTASGRVAATTTASTSTGTIVDYGYSLAGTSVLKTLTQGPVPVSGGITAKINLATQAFTGDLRLNNTRANLKLVGFIPVTANIGFEPVGQTTGTLKNGVLLTRSQEIIRLPQLYLFGSIPVAGAGGCRTKAPSTIALRSAEPQFNPLKGGPLIGAYTIGELVDCGALTGIISPFAQGSGNTINVTLTPAS